jgi:Fur family transcriptional regulator, ferric uptake regulator
MLRDNLHWFEILHQNGCRLTAPRRAVVETIEENMQALTPFEVYQAARKRCPGLGLVSVYRTLEILEQLGLVQRVHQTKGCQAFVRSGDGHQHLLVCHNCGKFILFEGDKLESLFHLLSNDTGFLIESHWLQVFGLCENCRSDS